VGEGQTAKLLKEIKNRQPGGKHCDTGQVAPRETLHRGDLVWGPLREMVESARALTHKRNTLVENLENNSKQQERWEKKVFPGSHQKSGGGIPPLEKKNIEFWEKNVTYRRPRVTSGAEKLGR